MTRSRRNLLALSAVVVLLSTACGDDPDATGGPPVIRLASAELAAGYKLGAAASGDAARMWAAPANVEYVLAGELPALDDPAAAWVIPADSPVTIERVRALAAALGVSGEPRQQPAKWGGGWMVGPDDGTAPSLGVSADAMGYWWYSPAHSDLTFDRCGVVGPLEAEGSAGAVDPGTAKTDATDAGTVDTVADTDVATVDDEVPVERCLVAEPPENVPSAEEAESLARELLSRLGEDPARYLFETYADDWGATVTAYLLLDGVRSPLTFTASFGGDGVLQYTAGTLAEPQRSADYPRIGTAAGFERLRSGEDPIYGVGRWSAYAAEEAIAEGASVPPDAAIDPAVGMPAPSEPFTVTITGVEEELVQVWDVDGNVHLLPAYAFISSDGARFIVSAVPSEYLVAAEPVPVTPTPEEPVPAPPDTSAVPDPDVTIDDPDATVDDTAADPIDPVFLESLIGIPEGEAVAAIEEAGWQARVVERDGEAFPVTMDYREDRINLVIADGRVTSATVG